jgi:hypothetical protein
MRIAWVTPFAAASALGAHSAAVSAALALVPEVEVEIWTADAEPLHATRLRVRQLGRDGGPEGYDAVFDNYDGAAEAAARRPGIVILHRRLGGGAPAPALGLITHSAADARLLSGARLEPVRRLSPEPPEAYAAALIDFVAEVQRVTPALELLDRVGRELATMRAAPGLAVFDVIAADFGRFLVL